MIKCFIFIGLLCGLLFPNEAEAQTRKKVAVVLSGGGAKGAAHIGALKVIEEAGIPVDIVVGTSMGSIVGGLYAIGYTSSQLDSMARRQDWNFLLTDRVESRSKSMLRRDFSEKFPFTIPLTRKKPKLSGFIRGENISSLFSELTFGYHGNLDFNQLPRQYACVATNMETGKEHVFHSGNLSVAMRASMAIPGVFTPVYLDSLVLVDGGLCNNYPADIAKQMGADIIIGVSVHTELRKSESLSNLNNILSQVIDLACRNKLEENAVLSDLFVHIDTDPYGTASFSSQAIDSLIIMGERAMREHTSELQRIKALVASDNHRAIPPFNSLAGISNVYLHSIHFEGANEKRVRRLLKRSRLAENSDSSLNQIDEAMDLIRDELAFSNVRYELAPRDSGYDLYLYVSDAKDTNLNIGVRYDSEQHASLLLGVNLRFNSTIPSALGLTGRLGERLMGRLDYTLTPSFLKQWTLAYTFFDNDVNVHQRADRLYNLSYRQHRLELSYSNVWWRDFRYDIGVRFDAFSNPEVLYAMNSDKFAVSNSGKFVNYFLRAKYSSFDKPHYPAEGIDINLEYTIHTDNFYQRRHHSPFFSLAGSVRAVLPISRKFALVPSFHSRALIGKDVSPFYDNYLGGMVQGQYYEQQIPFAGIYNLEVGSRTMWAGQLQLRQRLFGQHYLTLDGSLGGLHRKLKNPFKDSLIYGVGVGYGWLSMIGPLQINIGYSSHTAQFAGFINFGYYF